MAVDCVILPNIACCVLRSKWVLARDNDIAERERLIDSIWNGERERMWTLVERTGCRRDDLNDALTALWTARRIARGTARRMPWIKEFDGRGLRMEIAA